MYDGVANMFRAIRFLETVATNSAARYKWPHPFTLKMESCGRPGTEYDDEARVDYTDLDLADLPAGGLNPPPVAAVAPIPAASAEAQIEVRKAIIHQPLTVSRPARIQPAPAPPCPAVLPNGSARPSSAADP